MREPGKLALVVAPYVAGYKLKIPGPRGVITVHGDRENAIECEEGDAAFAESACAAEELKSYKSQVDPNDMSVVTTQSAEPPMKFKAAQDTKQIDLVPGDASKQASLGAHMEGEQERALIAFLQENKDIFA